MATDARPLIVGAGPTGLAAALFLHERGVAARIVDSAPEPAETSKALAFNPRTLELLEPSGVGAAIGAVGRPIGRARLTAGFSRELASIDIGAAHPRHRMTVLPQARTEALLTAELERRGLRPERGVALETLREESGGLVVTLRGRDGAAETVRPPILFGADGAHSPCRHALGLGFPGSTRPEPWPLFDIGLRADLDPASAHIALFDDGLVFCLALEPGLWRVLGNVPDPLHRLPPGTERGEIVWTSSFRISHRVASAVALGRVALGGDAAHVHSPIGARGMNLGIEDAYVFAAVAVDALAGRRPLSDYDRLRRPVHRAVVRRIGLMTALATGRPRWLRPIRDVALPWLTAFPPAVNLMRQAVTGLDHEVRLA